MAYNIDDVYKIVLYATSKNLQQGYVSPEDFNVVINQAQKSYASYLLGSFQQYQAGRPEARVQFGQNAVIRTRLKPIIYNADLTIDGTGFSPYPSDFLQTDAMWTYYGYERVREVQQNYFYSIYNSKIDAIPSWPVYLLEWDGFRFFPNSLSQAKMSYVRNPPDMIWAYTINPTTDLPVYDSANSVQPVWDDASILEIIARALRIIGVNLQYNDVSAYANQIELQGQ